jgi:hypothetical protein
MAKVIPINERFQHFVEELQESFWGELYGRTRQAWKKFFELESERLRDRYAGWPQHGRGARQAGGYRNGYYERGFATVFGTIRLRIARARGKSFLPPGVKPLQRRAPALAMLIREAFLRGLSTRQVGRVVSTLTGEVVSAQTVSRLIRDLDEAVAEFHRAPVADEWAYFGPRRQRNFLRYDLWRAELSGYRFFGDGVGLGNGAAHLRDRRRRTLAATQLDD